MENGLACDEHLAEARRRFAYYDRHPLGPACGQSGAAWFWEEKRCGYPDDPEQRTTLAALDTGTEARP